MALYFMIIVMFGVLSLGRSLGYSDIEQDKKCGQQFQVFFCLLRLNSNIVYVTTYLDEIF